MSARRDAIFALALWQTRGTFPSQALAGSEQYAFALELVGAVLRHKASLEWMLKQCVERMPKGELWAALMVGAAQLLVLPSVAEYAAISETVEAVKPTGKASAKFVNAILRRIQREKTSLLSALSQQPEALQRDVPKALWTRWVATFGEAQARQIAIALAQPPRVCVRPLPPFSAPQGCTPHPDDPTGSFIVPNGISVEALEGFAEGHFVVQDPATRFAIEALDVQPGQRVLDACAAPGGKTAQIAARVGAEGSVVANELSETRLAKLKDTLQRCKVLECVQISSQDATQFQGETLYDRILLDVPCSNTGVFGRRPDARWTWSKQKMQQLLTTQQALLEASAKGVVVGGRIVYSTCSIEPEEDDAQVQHFLSRHPNFECVATHLELPTERHDGAYAAALVRRA